MSTGTNGLETVKPISIRVLFIDPNDKERQDWVEQLSKRSSEYVLLQASTVESGLQLMKSEPIDCVVAELNYPDRSGLVVLTNLVPRPRRPEVPTIVLTDFTRAVLFPLALSHGAHSCLMKHHNSVDDLDIAIRKAIAVVGPKKNRAPS